MRLNILLASLIGPALTMLSPEANNVCRVEAQGSAYVNCDFDWATFNACDCYFQGDRQTACTYFKTVADGCTTNCKSAGNCTPHYASRPSVDVCKVAFQGAKYKECDFDWANLNACDCFLCGENRDQTCRLYREGAVKCDQKCAAEGNCTPH